VATIDTLKRIDARLADTDRDVLTAAKAEIERLLTVTKKRSDLLSRIFNCSAELPDDIRRDLQDFADGP